MTRLDLDFGNHPLEQGRIRIDAETRLQIVGHVLGLAGAGDDTGDGGIRRDQLARVLVTSLLTDTAIGKTFELFAQPGDAPSDWSALFGALDPDTGIDGAHDATRVPLEDEPAEIQRDVANVRTT